ncbi:MAG: dTDP-4-dehydrorhamnose 3,5-epimerase [Candidatus Omnitrophica bacterium CG11_big_fil_rev_8_21_14_0_20_63_9]|nr:MAG: dTDP-4-dehydrorhamnose 3,5-epimerase [Candidatus Omnitrophica bacterium CG11_big_fil_rev_8_21_14_0_20_63_9]
MKLIKGVLTKPLKVIPDERGRLFEMLRCDEPVFRKFGQVYCTTVNYGVVKGWHYHKKQYDNFICVHGMIKLVAYDSRPGSPTRGVVNEFFIGTHQPLLVQIPPGVLHGFKGLSHPDATVINVSTEPYHHAKPDEFRVAPHSGDVPYDWSQKDG